LARTPPGSGSINPFLRFQHKEGVVNSPSHQGIERAYDTDNTEVRFIDIAFPDDMGFVNQGQDVPLGPGGPQNGFFTHAINLSTLHGDNGFFHVLLDINEPGGEKSNLRLDEYPLPLHARRRRHQRQPQDARGGLRHGSRFVGATEV
jgi:hypothetical protein